jgi:hypothetical protein
MTDWKDPRGNLAKYQRQHNAGEISYDEMVKRESAELDWIQKRCPHKNREPDHATVWCDDCGADLGPSASTGDSGGLVVVKGGCVVVGAMLIGAITAVAWSLIETAQAIL